MRGSRLAAVVVVSALGGGAALMARSPAETQAPEESSPAVTTTVQVPADNSLIRHTATTAVPPAARGPERQGTPLDVVSEGMSAWGRFAVSGDLAEVGRWFSVHGPQYVRFVEEAEELAADPLGDPPYAMSVEGAELSAGEEKATVTARVVFVRTGEPSQSFRWAIVLRREAGMWRIWTVDSQADSKGEVGASGSSVPQN